MDNDRKEIFQFINTNFGSRFSKSHLSDISKIMINKIIYFIQLAQESIVYKDEILVMNENRFPKGDNYDYIIKEYRESIEKSGKIGKKYSFEINGRVFHVFLIFPIDTISVTIKNRIYTICDNYIKKIFIWLFIACQFADERCSPILNIYIYLTNHKKRIPKLSNNSSSESIIDRIHANTAFTMSCTLKSNEIYIYRYEEWFKVLIHESFHSLGLDFSKMPEENTNKKIYNIFPVKCDLRLYETYTEMWAEIINIIFTVYKKDIDKKTIDELHKDNKLMNKIGEYLEVEKWFSVFQCIKILRNYGIKYRALYENTEYAKEMRQNYKENTNIFSYYILKSIIMVFYNDFIEFTIINNRGSLNFKKTQNSINKLCDFIKDRYNSKEYLKFVDIIEKWFLDIHKKKWRNNNNEISVMETMRMSVFG